MPSGYWLVRLFKHEDVRTHGSGNIGATNVWRTYGRWYGVPVVLLDTAKGFVPALVFSLTVSPLAGVLAGAAAMLGHARPVFLRFEKGGKMVATTAARSSASPRSSASSALGVWIPVFLLTRYASVASIVAALSLPVAAVAARPLVAGRRLRRVAAGAVVLLHRSNIKRLLHGEESRFVFRKRTVADRSSRPESGRPEPGSGRGLERRHRQAEALEPLPVELGCLPVAAPDDRATGVVDPVREAQSLVVVDPGIVEASANATPSNVLWLSFRTITFHGRPSAGAGVGRRRVRVSVTEPVVQRRVPRGGRAPSASSARSSPTVP